MPMTNNFLVPFTAICACCNMCNMSKFNKYCFPLHVVNSEVHINTYFLKLMCLTTCTVKFLKLSINAVLKANAMKTHRQKMAGNLPLT